MRRPDQLVHSRARVRPRYALLPLEGFPPSRLPSWPDAEVRVLAAPGLGANFVQYLVDVPKGGGAVPNFRGDPSIESFVFMLHGTAFLQFEDDGGQDLGPGGYAFVSPDADTFELSSQEGARLLVLQKRYEKHPMLQCGNSFVRNVSDVKAEVWADNPHSRLQALVPDVPSYDLAMNIFTFDPGHGLPYVETHVMEHGLLFLEGKGLYYLDGEWMEVEKDDFIWMGPYCPQSFVATGPTPAKYIYYKNVNREISL
jgi:(S)-ureidoglycine aminohydrolase